NLLAAGADVVGMNCGRGPDRAIAIIREMRGVTGAPLVAYPNAGLPVTTGDHVTYELGPAEMARDYPALLDAGCTIVGACCGSNPGRARPPPRGRPAPPRALTPGPDLPAADRSGVAASALLDVGLRLGAAEWSIPPGPGREVGYRESVANPLGGPDPVVLRDVPLEIDPAEVRAFLSYRPPLRLPAAELAGRLETACAEIAGLLAPRVACRTRPVTHARL